MLYVGPSPHPQPIFFFQISSILDVIHGSSATCSSPPLREHHHRLCFYLHLFASRLNPLSSLSFDFFYHFSKGSRFQRCPLLPVLHRVTVTLLWSLPPDPSPRSAPPLLTIPFVIGGAKTDQRGKRRNRQRLCCAVVASRLSSTTCNNPPLFIVYPVVFD